MAEDGQDVRRQLVGDDVGQRHALEHGADIGAERDPDLRERLRRSGVDELVRALAAHAGQRAVNGADHVGDGDLTGKAAQPVSAVVPAPALHQALLPEVGEDVLEERHRDALGLRDELALDRCSLVARGELDEGADGVVGLG